MSDYLIVRLLAIRGKRMSNCQCQWCGRSYNPYGDPVMMHREKLDFCSERCRHEARSSGWKSPTEKRIDKSNEAYAREPPCIKNDKEIRNRRRRTRDENFHNFWWKTAMPIVALIWAFLVIHSSGYFFNLRWPPTSADEWIYFLCSMCLFFPVGYIVATICLFPVMLIIALILWVT